jgi:hypothetical protein
METRSGSLLAGVAGLMSVVMLFQACGGADAPSLVMSASRVHELDGKELFRGLILGRGEVAAHFPETWGAVGARKSAIIEMDPAEVIERLDLTARYMAEK